MANIKDLIQSIEQFNLNSNTYRTIDSDDYKRLNDLMEYSIQLIKQRKDKLEIELDKAQRTYNRWVEKKEYIKSMEHDILTIGLIPNRESFKQLMLVLPEIIKSFDALPDVYGNSWIVYRVRGKDFVGEQFRVSGLIKALRDRLNSIGVTIYPDLMF